MKETREDRLYMKKLHKAMDLELMIGLGLPIVLIIIALLKGI